MIVGEGEDDVVRMIALPVAVGSIALLATACGGGSAKPPQPGSAAYYKDAVAYSQCMRAHGEPGFPDPQPNGNLLIDGKQDYLVGGSVMGLAEKACGLLMPKQAPLTAAQQRQLSTKALKFVACMRSHGVPDFPDPVINANGISMSVGPGVDPGSPTFQAAQQTCRKLAPGFP